MAEVHQLAEMLSRWLSPNLAPQQTSTSSAERPRPDPGNIRKRIKAESATKSFLRSVGLKAVPAEKWLKRADPQDRLEQKKVLVSTSWRIALTQIAVHLLPVSISVFLIAFNTVELLNGPNITTVSTFFLQVAAKFHELTIAGSVTVVVLDVIRYHLLNEGINLGLLSSAFSLVGLNFLWSPNFLSIFRAKYSLSSKIWLLFVLVISCSLVAVVGPASALLFIPTQVWKDFGGTEFYLGGTDSQLWPTHFTVNHTGPDICHQNPPVLEMVCPYGGYTTLSSQLLNPPNTASQILLDDRDIRRVLTAHTYWCTLDVDHQGTSEVWVYTARGDTTHLLADLLNKYNIAQSHATGRNRRLRDFICGGFVITEGQIPVGRTVCGPPMVIEDDTKALPFPILAPNHKWQNLSSGLKQSRGPLRDFNIGGLQRLDILTKSTQARAKWVALGSDFGAATAGVAFVSQNETTAVGRGCTVDMRWALGQTFNKRNTILNAIEPQVGQQSVPIGSTYWGLDRQDFFDQDLTPWYGETIKVDQEWLDAMSPWSILTKEPGGYNMTGFEALLDATLIAIPDNAMFMGPENACQSQVMLEYITSVYFVDALSRTGWDLSLLYPDAPIINPLLQDGSSENQKLLNGGPLFNRPTNLSYTTVHANWHTYGTAWTLHQSGQWISVAVLAVHMVIAIVHSVFVVWKQRSMDAWDSINELVVLAWDSMPTRRDYELRNCAAGIYRTRTLESKVRVVSIEEDGVGSRQELVVIDEKGKARDGRAVEGVRVDEAYI